MHTKRAYGVVLYFKTLKQRSSSRVKTSLLDSASLLVSVVSVAVWRHTAIALSFCILGTVITQDPYHRFWYRQSRKRLCRYPENFLYLSQLGASPSQQMPQPQGRTCFTLHLTARRFVTAWGRGPPADNPRGGRCRAWLVWPYDMSISLGQF